MDEPTVPMTPKALAGLMSIDDHLQALKRIDELMDAEAETPEGKELEWLAILVEAYEKIYFPIGEGAQNEKG